MPNQDISFIDPNKPVNREWLEFFAGIRAEHAKIEARKAAQESAPKHDAEAPSQRKAA